MKDEFFILVNDRNGSEILRYYTTLPSECENFRGYLPKGLVLDRIETRFKYDEFDDLEIVQTWFYYKDTKNIYGSKTK